MVHNNTNEEVQIVAVTVPPGPPDGVEDTAGVQVAAADTNRVEEAPPTASTAATTNITSSNDTSNPHETAEQSNIATVLTNNDKQQQQQQQPTTSSNHGSSSPTSNKRKGSKNAGSKKGGKRTDRPQSFWYRLCQIYDQGGYKSQIDFLRSPDSGEQVGEPQRMHFSRAYKKYQNGTLGNCEETRSRKRKYEPLELRGIQYWTEQQELLKAAAQQQQQQQQQQGDYHEPQDPAVVTGGGHVVAAADGGHQQQQQQQHHPHNNHLMYDPVQAATHGDFGFPAAPAAAAAAAAPQNSHTNKRRRNKGGGSSTFKKSPLAWSILQQKAKDWAQELGLDDGFQASAGWIDNVLKRHQRDVEARQNRESLDVTLATRRTGANFGERQGLLWHDLQRADQQAYVVDKDLRVGDRVTVLDISQQAGDLVITHLRLPASSPSSVAAAAVAGKDKTKPTSRTTRGEATEDKEDEDSNVIYVTVERRRHGSTQSFSIHDVRKVVKHLAQGGEDSATMQQLLRPGLLALDSFVRATAHFPKKAAFPAASRVLRPIWETKRGNNGHPAEQDGSDQSHKMITSSLRLSYCDTSCAEKISIHALRSHILPMFRKDQKERDKLVEELQTMSTRSKSQQDVLEKLQYAQMAHEMAKDLFELVRTIPAKDKTIVYQVDYQAFDASLRGRLFAANPAPLPKDALTKSYAPRPLTLQAMPEDLRTALVGSFAHWITTTGQQQQDMGVVILCSLADMAHASHLIPSWLDYQQHATAWCEFIQQVHGGVSREQAQLLPQILLQGGTYETWKQAMDEQTETTIPSSNDESWTSLQTFVLRLATEWRALRDVVLALPQYAWAQLDKAALLASHDCAPAVIPNICLARIMQACERDIWTLVGHVAQAQGWTIRAKLVDGLLVEAPSMAGPLANVLSLAEAAVKSRGWGIGLVEGPCFGLFHYKEPMPLLQRAQKAMEDVLDESGREGTGRE